MSTDNQVQEIIKSQEMIDRIIVANSDSIKRLDIEIAKLERKKEADEPLKDKKEADVKDETKRCRYYNKGFCKYEKRCRYFHPQEICQNHLDTLNCNLKGCKKRHPKVCKWFQKDVGCKREENCDFLHVTSACGDDGKTAHKEIEYKCAGCKSMFPSEQYVVKHEIQNTEIFFCLNCEDWIGNKEQVLRSDWILFDGNGCLRRDV